MKKTIGIIGAGKLGSSLIYNFKKTGCTISGITCQPEQLTVSIAKKFKVKPFSDNIDLVKNSDIIFLTVPDAIIADVFAQITPVAKNKIIFHCSGALASSSIEENMNINLGSFHPLQTFARYNTSFKNIYIAIDGNKKVQNLAKSLANMLGAQTIAIPSQDRALYHAAACIASNHLVTLLAVVEQIFTNWSDDKDAAKNIFLPLVQASIKNFSQLESKNALTGPIARGDNITIKKHLAVLPDDLLDFYKIMSLQTLKLAKKSDKLCSKQIKELEKLLKNEV